MPKPLEVVRPHDMRCRLCIEYDEAGNPLVTSGHYLCQNTECQELADYTWARFSGDGDTTVPMLACEAHTLPVEVRDKVHRQDCPAPDPGCVCSWG